MSRLQTIDLGERGWQILHFPELVDNPSEVKAKVLELAGYMGYITVHGDYPGAMPISPDPNAPTSFFGTAGKLKIHTDVAWGKIPPRYIVMAAEIPDADGGGVSRHVNAWKTFQSLPDSMQHLLIEKPVKIPAAPHHIRAADMIDFGERQGIIRPSVSFDRQGLPLLRLIPDETFYNLNSDQPDVLEAITIWDEANEKAAESIFLELGMVALSDNHKIGHARGAFIDRNQSDLEDAFIDPRQSDPEIENRLLWRAYSNPVF